MSTAGEGGEQEDELVIGDLEAEVHGLPLLVQIGQHVGVRDGGAVLALFGTLAALSLTSLALVALFFRRGSMPNVGTPSSDGGAAYPGSGSGSGATGAVSARTERSPARRAGSTAL